MKIKTLLIITAASLACIVGLSLAVWHERQPLLLLVTPASVSILRNNQRGGTTKVVSLVIFMNPASLAGFYTPCDRQ